MRGAMREDQGGEDWKRGGGEREFRRNKNDKKDETL